MHYLDQINLVQIFTRQVLSDLFTALKVSREVMKSS